MSPRAKRSSLIVVGPLPPPLHGVTVSTSLVLSSSALQETFAIHHLDTSDHRPPRVIGRWDATNIVLAILHSCRLVFMVLRYRRGVFYFPLSANSGGFVRDSWFIHIAALARWRVAGHLRGSEFRSLFYERRGRLLQWWVRTTLRRVTSMAVLGETLRPIFADLIPADRISVVPNGTPDVAPEPAPSRDRHTVVFLSNLRRRKGVVEALEAALLVTKNIPDARFIFAGDTDEPSLIPELVSRAAPAGDQIVFLPTVDGEQKAHLLSSAGVFLFPPRLPEGHPRVLLEAMAAGMAIITTARGAIPETVEDGIEAFVLEDPEVERMAECLTRLLTDVDFQAKMGAAARARYVADFTQQQADKRLARWLATVASARSPSTRTVQEPDRA